MKLKKLLKCVNDSNMIVIINARTGMQEKGVYVNKVKKKYLNSKVVHITSYGADEDCDIDYLSVIVDGEGGK